jgi:hypothetical protein
MSVSLLRVRIAGAALRLYSCKMKAKYKASMNPNWANLSSCSHTGGKSYALLMPTEVSWTRLARTSGMQALEGLCVELLSGTCYMPYLQFARGVSV